MNENSQVSKTMEKVISYILSTVCYVATIYTIVILFLRYNENLDSSQISMKVFNQSPEGRYPSFTFCIFGEDGVMLNGDRLEQKYGVRKKDIYAFWSGETGFENSSNYEMIDFEKSILEINDIMAEISAEDETYNVYQKWNPSMGREKIPLLSRYRDPSTNCFVYDTFNDPDINLYTLKMYFNITSLASIFSEEAKMYFHVHYPGQMVRNMKNYIVKVKDWHRFGSEQMNNEIFVQIVLRY